MNQNRLNNGLDGLTCSLGDKGPSPYITKLKQRLSDLVEKEEGSRIEYTAGAIGDALYKDKDVAIQMMNLKAGAQFPAHVHPTEREWLIVIKGSATVQVDGVERIVNARNHLVIEPGHEHSGVATEDLWHIAISIPADEGYPNVYN